MGVAVVGNVRLPFRSLNKNQVTALYLGKPVAGVSDKNLFPVDQQSSSLAYTEFYKKLLGWSGAQVNNYWSRLVFSGEANPPTVVDSDQAVINTVEDTAGAIGYINASYLSGLSSRVKVLLVLGRLPVKASRQSKYANVKAVLHVPDKSTDEPKFIKVRRAINPRPKVIKRDNIVESSLLALRKKRAARLASQAKDKKKFSSHKNKPRPVAVGIKSPNLTLKKEAVAKQSSRGASKTVASKSSANDNQPKGVKLKNILRQLSKDSATKMPVVSKSSAISKSIPLDLEKTTGASAQYKKIHLILNNKSVIPKNETIYHDNYPPINLILSSSGHADLWQIMSKHFELKQDMWRSSVQSQVRYFLRNRYVLNIMLKNAVPYLYYVYHETQKRHMPAELALLPMVESAYDPFAYSRAGASGLWQMMPGTAVSYNLSINWWYDGRSDILASTQAALNFLEILNKSLGNWPLALAGYNAGSGRVLSAINYNRSLGRPTSFWNLSLPKETEAYVPKLLALAYIIEHHNRYHVSLPPVANQPYFAVETLQNQITLTRVAKLTGASLRTIRWLNPGVERYATGPNGQYNLLIPMSTKKMFERRLAKLKYTRRYSWVYHEVRSRDTLSSIAHNYHTSLSLLRKVNNLKVNQAVYPKEGLLVPLWLNETVSQLGDKKKLLPLPVAQPTFNHLLQARKIVYTFAKGDTLNSIASQYYVTADQLRVWNDLQDSALVKPGTSLVIWLSPMATSSGQHNDPANLAALATSLKTANS